MPLLPLTTISSLKQANIDRLVDIIHTMAREKGWWDAEPHNIPEKLALIHSEISEALEAYRDLPHDKLNTIQYGAGSSKPEGFAVELADAVIRIMDLCGHLDIDLAEIMAEKILYNQTRPYRHGGKRA